MYKLLTALVFAALLLSGCASPPAPASHATFDPIEPPKDGKILILVSGNATERGRLWVQGNASLATIEDLFAVRPEFASRRVFIVRRELDGARGLQFRMDRMSRNKKEKVKVYHGDSISFVWDRCFGFAPNQSLRPTPGRVLNSTASFTSVDLARLGAGQ
jgi:hypothetical protein